MTTTTTTLTQKVFLLAGIAAANTFALAQTANCNDNAGGQLIVGSGCSPVTFNTADNGNWWSGSGMYGFCDEFFGDAWMWFDATSTSTTIVYDPLVEDAILTIFQGTCNAAGPSVACSDLYGYGGAETITLATVPGIRYHIRIENYWGNGDMAGTVCAYSPTGGGSTTASDCSVAANICTNLSFSIDPNGYGAINEIPVPGTYPGNPDINPFSFNEGCLLYGEYNSTWMVINVATTGYLEFVFGGLGAQAGYFDWIMYPYNGASTCTGIMSNSVAPVRCNWNWVNYGGTGVSDVIPAGGNSGNFEPPLAVTAGQRYIICFSNYSNLATTVPLSFITGAGNADVSCTPLGFSMEGLSVECLDGARRLSWSAPVNNVTDRFEVQKSFDNQSWETTTTVYSGTVSNGKMNYSVIDETNPAVLEYYRLKQYSNDGEVSVSAVISSDCDSEKETYRIYPNPTTGLMNLEYKSMSEGTLSFYDVYGNLVYSQKLERATESKAIQILATDVPSGMYMYRLLLENEVKTGSVIIQK